MLVDCWRRIHVVAKLAQHPIPGVWDVPIEELRQPGVADASLSCNHRPFALACAEPITNCAVKVVLHTAGYSKVLLRMQAPLC